MRFTASLQFRVLGFGFLECGYVGIRVFPKRKKFLVLVPGSVFVACRRFGSCQLEL